MAGFTNTRESGLEALIVRWLIENNDYEEGSNADYNKEYVIDETRLFHFLQDTQPERMDKLGVFKSEQKKRQFLNRLQGEITKHGVIGVLHNGIKVYTIDRCWIPLLWSLTAGFSINRLRIRLSSSCRSATQSRERSIPAILQKLSQMESVLLSP